MASKKTKTEQLTLAEIRAALEAVEAQRATKDLTEEERIAFEEASLTLRNAERAAIADAEKGIISDFEAETKQVSLQAKQINETVAKLNKLPNLLSTTQKVIKECVQVLKAIAKWSLMLIWIMLVVSCATLSKSQMTKIKALSITSDTVALAPQLLFEKLADVRMERGLLYAASLEGTETRISEINALAQAAVSDATIAKKAGVYVNVLNSYLKALKSLSADTRWKKNGTELKGIGRNIDSLLIAYNKLEWSDPIEPGLSKQLGKTTGYVAEEIGKRVQRKKVLEVLESGDSLISTSCDALVKILKKEELNRLIENEEQGLESNYRSYLNAAYRHDVFVPTDMDRQYLKLKSELTEIRGIQSKCASALTSLKNAHHKLLSEMDKSKKYDEYNEELQQLASEAASLCSYISKSTK